MRNLANIAYHEAAIGLPPEVGMVQFAARDEENNAIYLGGSGLCIVCINATTFEVRRNEEK
jgi:hypothetical protein